MAVARTEDNSYPLHRMLVDGIKSSDKSRKSVLVFSHRQGDPDAICAAFAVSSLLTLWGEESGIDLQAETIVPQGASQLGSRVAKKFNILYEESVEESKVATADLIIAIDVGDVALLEPFAQAVKESQATRILIDHHGQSAGDTPEFDKKFVRHRATSTCEIVASGVDPREISKEIAEVLLVGILFDSQHLGLATEETLESVLVLIRRGASIETSREILRSKPDRSELIARLKSAQRLRISEMGPYFFLSSEVSSFHASVARMLVEIGGDVGVAYGESGGEARLSVRCTGQLRREAGIDLGETLEGIAKDHASVIGGGHPTAASIAGKIEPGELLKALERRVREHIQRT